MEPRWATAAAPFPSFGYPYLQGASNMSRRLLVATLLSALLAVLTVQGGLYIASVRAIGAAAIPHGTFVHSLSLFLLFGLPVAFVVALVGATAVLPSLARHLATRLYRLALLAGGACIGAAVMLLVWKALWGTWSDVAIVVPMGCAAGLIAAVPYVVIADGMEQE